MKKAKLNIAMIGQKGIPAVYGGVERHVEEIAKRLVIKGHDVTVFCRPYYMEQNNLKLQDYHGIKLCVLPTIKSKHLDAITHTFISSLYVLLKNYDICHYHAIGPSTFSFIPRLIGKKSVVTVHGLDWQRQKWGGFATFMLRLGEQTAYYFPHKTITVSKSLKNYYDREYKGDVVYIPNGVTIPEQVQPNIIKRKYNLGQNEYIVFISRLVPEKGCHYLIDAFKQIKTDRKLVIVGGSSHSDEYVKKLKAQVNDDKRIIFTGNVFGDELAELFSNAYFFVLPSDIEGLPIVILESLSFQKCVLASDIPENMEVIAPQGNDEYGYHFKQKSVDDLRKKMQMLLAEPDLINKMSRKAVAYVRQSFNWDSITDELESVYMELINK